MQDIVKFHNDLNKVKLPSLTEQEQNIFFGIISKIKTKGEGKIGRATIISTPNQISYSKETIKFTPQELFEFSTENLTNKALGDLLTTLREKIFKADFTMLIEKDDEDLIGKVIINLFETFALLYPKNDTEYNNLLRVEMTIHPYFAYLVNELRADFTRFELAEFIALSGKYTKTLYRLLKQFRQTGWAEWDFKEFKDLLDIPEDYEMCNIDQRILKPAIKELTQERNLFDFGKRIPFKDLKYIKIKKGGNRVTAIRFEWKKEKVQEGLEAEAMERIAENMKNHIPTSADYNAKQEFENYKGVEVSFYDSNNRLRIAEIKDFDNETNQLLCYDKKVNQNFYIPFENLQKANTWIAEKLKGIV